jgi:nucleoside-diphosphate-sugar epimerase
MAIAGITGATGFIGRHVVPLLLGRGYSVRALLRPDSQRKTPSGVEVIPGDVTDAAAVNSLVQNCDVVLHLAGQAHTDLKTSADRERAIAVNVGGSRNVFQACQQLGVRRVVVASSAHVYEGQRGHGVSEQAPQKAENLYAQTKIDIERLAREFSANGLEVVIGRPCLTYGPNAGFNLLKLMRAIDRGMYFHVGNMKVERSFCSAYSAAAAFVFLAEKGTAGAAYNIADHNPALLADFTNDLADRMKRRRPRSITYPLLWSAATGGSALSAVGLNAPITLASLRKLTESFSISVGKLADAGFVWPDTGDRARQDMVDAYLAGAQ